MLHQLDPQNCLIFGFHPIGKTQFAMIEAAIVPYTIGKHLQLHTFIYLFIWGFTLVSTLYRSYHDR